MKKIHGYKNMAKWIFFCKTLNFSCIKHENKFNLEKYIFIIEILNSSKVLIGSFTFNAHKELWIYQRLIKNFFSVL